MGIYILCVDEFSPKFKSFLMGQEGEVRAPVVARSWNEMAKENMWNDRLISITVDLDEIKEKFGSFENLKEFSTHVFKGLLDTPTLQLILDEPKWRQNLLLLCALCEGLFEGE